MHNDLNPAPQPAYPPAPSRRLVAALLCATLIPSWSLAAGQYADNGIIAIKENGKTVYVNNDAPRRPPAKAEPASAPRASVLVYWSSKERRWKPVPPPSPSAMRAAKKAAAEVATYVESRPASVRPATLRPDPNYRDLMQGRSVSNTEVDAAIREAAARHHVDVNLVRAIVKVESNFNPQAVSRKGAMGLMQLMPETAQKLNVANPFDPRQNLDGGVRHLKSLMQTFNGDLSLSLAAYNAGEKAVSRHNTIPDNGETPDYVKQITSLYWTGKSGALKPGSGSAAVGSLGLPGSARGSAGMGAERPARDPIRLFRDTNDVVNLTNE